MGSWSRRELRPFAGLGECGVKSGVFRRCSVLPVLTVHRVRFRFLSRSRLEILAFDTASYIEEESPPIRQGSPRRVWVMAPDSIVWRLKMVSLSYSIIFMECFKASAACQCCRGAGCSRIHVFPPFLEEGLGMVGPKHLTYRYFEFLWIYDLTFGGVRDVQTKL